jgi:hypothetical protein
MICRMGELPTVATGHKSRQKVVGQCRKYALEFNGRSATVGHEKLLTRLARAAPSDITCSTGQGLRRHYRANVTNTAHELVPFPLIENSADEAINLR